MQISTPKPHGRVAYQGVPGAYSEGAARAACPDHEPLPCEQFEVAFQALSQWMAERACLPIENSLGGALASAPRADCPPRSWYDAPPCKRCLGKHLAPLAGSIHTVYDLLLRYNLHIVGEKFIKVNHCLMAQPGVKRAELTRVLSHPQALAQCQDYLRNLGAVKEAVEDTAGTITT